MNYRRDIDGLRAVAVLSVVLYHAGVTWIPGGFVGVDVFFVISGYLITRILIDETSSGRFSLTRFYVRRARRILPALYVLLAVVFLVGMFLLLPLELLGLSRSLVATALFSSNFLFWKESGYFDAAAELKPFLHTWSLAVEEQFYVLWPLALTFWQRRGLPIRWLVAILAALSFFLSCWYLMSKPAAVFFLLPGRSWELLLGAWLAVGNVVRPEATEREDWMSIVGLSLVLGSAFFLDKSSPFPGWNALWPCIGAALLIAAGKGSYVNRTLLSIRPLVFVGLVSYSFYLWHWPILTYLRILNLGKLPEWQGIAGVCISFALAILSWRFVEKPFRKAEPQQQATSVLLRYAVGGAVLCFTGGTVAGLDGLPGRLPPSVIEAQAAANDFNSSRRSCHLDMDQGWVPSVSKCLTKRADKVSGKTLVIWGDSHAEALVPGLLGEAVGGESYLLQLTKTSCPPLLGVSLVRGGREYRKCAEFNRRVMDYLKQHPEVSTVTLAARWPVYVLNSGFGVPDQIMKMPAYSINLNSEEQARNSDSLETYKTALNQTVTELVSAGKQVVVLGAIPEMMFDVPSCVARKRLTDTSLIKCDLDQDAVFLRISAVNSIIEMVTQRSGVTALFPHQPLCRDGRCRTEGDGKEVLYYDHHHLTTVGAKYVFSRLKWN